MRAISQYTRFGIQVQPQYQQGMGDGSVTITQRPIYANFDPDALIYDKELERAERTFSFRGRTQHIDEATPTDILSRLSVLDTTQQGWNEETREKVEAKLRELEPLTPDDFFIAEETSIPAPFPAWDASEKPAFELVASLVEMGFDLQEALDYERIFGPGREAVIEALEETIKDAQEETIEA